MFFKTENSSLTSIEIQWKFIYREKEKRKKNPRKIQEKIEAHLRIRASTQSTKPIAWNRKCRHTFSWSCSRREESSIWTGSQHPWLWPCLHSMGTSLAPSVSPAPSLLNYPQTQETFFFFFFFFFLLNSSVLLNWVFEAMWRTIYRERFGGFIERKRLGKIENALVRPRGMEKVLVAHLPTIVMMVYLNFFFFSKLLKPSINMKKLLNFVKQRNKYKTLLLVWKFILFGLVHSSLSLSLPLPLPLSKIYKEEYFSNLHILIKHI